MRVQERLIQSIEFENMRNGNGKNEKNERNQNSKIEITSNPKG
jgi:hypothetical protein